MKRQKPAVGDIFAIPLLDGGFSIGQIVGEERQVLNSITCAFFELRISELAGDIDPSESKVFSCIFVTRDLLKNGRWKILKNSTPIVSINELPHEDIRNEGWVGAKMYGSKIVEEFVNAFYGLTYWDDWKDPSYLDALLISPKNKPKKLKLKAEPGVPYNSGQSLRD